MKKATKKEEQNYIKINNVKISRNMNLTKRTGLSKEDFEAAALSSDAVKILIDGKQVVKVIAVPGKLINIVIKG